MAKKQNITETGPLTWKALQELNSVLNAENKLSLENYDEYAEEQELNALGQLSKRQQKEATSINDVNFEPRQVRSPLMQNSNGKDYWGNSIWDKDVATAVEMSNLSDIRAENQPWYSQIVNGILKAPIIAATTALDTAIGIPTGIIQGAINAITYDKDKDPDGENNRWGAFVHSIWDNPVIRFGQQIEEGAEKYLPNYYTQDEQENPFSHIFNANFIGDKLIKNFGFMVGAFYGGLPVAAGLGRAGTAAVKTARRGLQAEIRGMENAAKAITKGAANAEQAESLLTEAGLTATERAAAYTRGLDRIRGLADITKGSTMLLGSLSSAIGEGAIEAINNSKDWVEAATAEENDKYMQIQQQLAEIEDPEERELALIEEAEKHQQKIAEIQRGRVAMGNADFGLNLPILLASNLSRVGKLYARGFDSARRDIKKLLAGNRNVTGNLADGSLKSTRSMYKGYLKGLNDANIEGLEEYFQRAASDAAGNTVMESIDRQINGGKSEEAYVNSANLLVNLGKSVLQNFSDPNALEEYVIGSMSALLGMPTFGKRQMKNAYVSKGSVGLSGGLFGTIQDYQKQAGHEQELIKHLNDRVKDENFSKLWEALRKNGEIEAAMNEALSEKDKAKYNDLEFEELFNDINAAASLGKLSEFKALVGYSKDYSAEELAGIIKDTSYTKTAKEQKDEDEQLQKAYTDRLASIDARIQQGENFLNSKVSKEAKAEERNFLEYLKETRKELKEEKKAVDNRLKGTYKDMDVGPFINKEMQMDTQPDVDKNGNPIEGTEGNEMRRILEQNRKNMLSAIDNYARFRNDIDIETDGRLSDKQLTTLTKLRMQLWNKETRSNSMASDILSYLNDFAYITEEQVSSVKEAVDKAKESGNPGDQLIAEKRFENTKEVRNFVKKLTQTRPLSIVEKLAYKKGAKGVVEIPDEVPMDAEELQDFLLHKNGLYFLNNAIQRSTLDLATKRTLMDEAEDLHRLAVEKIIYDRTLREFIGDPELLNQAVDRLNQTRSKEEVNKQATNLIERIKNINNYNDLDKVLRDSMATDSFVAEEALNQIMNGEDENLKKFIGDYNAGQDFFNAFNSDIGKIPGSEVTKSAVAQDAFNAWHEAMANPGAKTLQEAFIEKLGEASKAHKKSGDIHNLEISKAIDQMLKTLKKVDSVSKNKKATAKGSSKSSAPKPKKKKLSVPTKSEQHEELLNDIKEELLDFLYGHEIKDVNLRDFQLSKELQKGIDEFNDSLSEEEAKKYSITDLNGIVSALLNTIQQKRAEISNIEKDTPDKDNKVAKAEEKAISERKAIMKATLRVRFKSDRVSEFDLESSFPQPYETSTSTNPEQNKKIQDIMTEYKGYTFVNENFLGMMDRYARKRDEDVVVHYIQSTEEGLENIVFLAVEVEQAKKAIDDILGKQDNYNAYIKPVTINGKEYQLVGTLAVNEDTNVNPDVRDHFISFVSRVQSDFEERRKNSKEPFVTYTDEELQQAEKENAPKTAVIDNIYTGKIVEHREEADNAKIPILDFFENPLALSSGKSLSASREWNSKKFSFPMGIVIGGTSQMNSDNYPPDMEIVPLNTDVLAESEGKVFVWLPKADGKFYPMALTKRNVKEFLMTTQGVKTEEEIDYDKAVELIFNNPNSYFATIKRALDGLLSNKNPLKNKQSLTNLFNFGKDTSPYFFQYRGEDVLVTVTARTAEGRESITLSSSVDDRKNTYKQFLQFLVKHNVQFSCNKGVLRDTKGLLESNVFMTGIKSPYNINPNFTILPVDREFRPVIANPLILTEEMITPVTPDEVTVEGTAYILNPDGTVYNKETQEEITGDTATLVQAVYNCHKKDNPYSLFEYLFDTLGVEDRARFKTLLKASFEQDYPKYEGVSIIHFKNEKNEEVYYLYDRRIADSSKRLIPIKTDSHGLVEESSLNSRFGKDWGINLRAKMFLIIKANKETLVSEDASEEQKEGKVFEDNRSEDEGIKAEEPTKEVKEPVVLNNLPSDPKNITGALTNIIYQFLKDNPELLNGWPNTPEEDGFDGIWPMLRRLPQSVLDSNISAIINTLESIYNSDDPKEWEDFYKTLNEC